MKKSELYIQDHFCANPSCDFHIMLTDFDTMVFKKLTPSNDNQHDQYNVMTSRRHLLVFDKLGAYAWYCDRCKERGDYDPYHVTNKMLIKSTQPSKLTRTKITPVKQSKA